MTGGDNDVIKPLTGKAAQRPARDRPVQHLGRRRPLVQDRGLDVRVDAVRPQGPSRQPRHDRQDRANPEAQRDRPDDRDGRHPRCRYIAGAGELFLFGRRIYTAGANDARAVEKIQGLTLAGAYGDEVATWPEDLWDMLGTRLSIPGAQFFGTCNPAGPVHWLKRLARPRRDVAWPRRHHHPAATQRPDQPAPVLVHPRRQPAPERRTSSPR
jgi:hypothetical protein